MMGDDEEKAEEGDNDQGVTVRGKHLGCLVLSLVLSVKLI